MQTGDFTGYGCPASPLNAALPALAELNLNHIVTLPNIAGMAADSRGRLRGKAGDRPCHHRAKDPETERDGSSGETLLWSIVKVG